MTRGPAAADAASLQEQQLKHERIRALLEERSADALLLRRASSFAWATGGISSVVNQASDAGEGMLLVRGDERLLIANAIEAPRYIHETPAEARGWQVVQTPWEAPDDVVAARTRGLVLSDVASRDVRDVSAELRHMRARLLPAEQERFAILGSECARVVEGAVRAVRRGMPEHELAARIAHGCLLAGIEPIVVLVAADERVYRVRHPRPTARPIERHALGVLCGRRDGLVCSVSRAVHLGRLDEDLRRRHMAAATVDARLLAATRPGATLGSLFQVAVDAYEQLGFAGEWRAHHQGGLAGYEPRELVAAPGDPTVVEAGMACAWNPSVAGAKSEDTAIVQAGGVRLITDTGEWPRVAARGVDAPPRPDILELPDEPA